MTAPDEINIPVTPCGNMGVLANLAPLPKYEPLNVRKGIHTSEYSFLSIGPAPPPQKNYFLNYPHVYI